MALESSPKQTKAVEDRERVIVRFAGDDELDALLAAGDTWTVA